jgi:hypothetical protein
MSLAVDLLAQAKHLAGLDPTRPKQANLRRAVSAAYYALFHLLVAECAQKISPRTPASLVSRIARSFVHTEMKEVCLQIARRDPGPVLRELIPGGFSPELRRVATAFVARQLARHQADYDLSAAFTRLETGESVDQARSAFQDWALIRDADEANVFLAALAFGRRWAK